MPFTTSHAAAVLPLLRTPLPASALVIGSMAPTSRSSCRSARPGHAHRGSDRDDRRRPGSSRLAPVARPALPSGPGGGAPRRARSADRRRARRPDPAPRCQGRAAHRPRAGRRVGHPRWGLLPGYRWLQYASSLVGALLLLGWLALWWRRPPSGRSAATGALVALGPAGRRGRRRRWDGRGRLPQLRCGRVRRNGLGWWRCAGGRRRPRGRLARAAADGQEFRSSLNAWPQPPEANP
jgi:hypothetical protein